MGSTEISGTAPLHHEIARLLGTEIIEGVWAPNEVSTMEGLQGRFKVSRTVAREAVRALESMGLVVTRRRVGIAPQRKESWKLLDAQIIAWRLNSARRNEQIASLTQLRMAVEPAAAESMALSASIHQRAALLPIAAEMRRSGEAGLLNEYLEHDIDFHCLVLRSSGNELFAAMADLVEAVLRSRTEQGLMPPQPVEESLAAHEAVARAVFEGTPEASREAMQKVIDEVRESLVVGASHCESIKH